MKRNNSYLKVFIFCTFIVSLILCINTAFAVTIHVPSDYATIQEAITAAIDGDIVLVADGTYTGAGNKNLDFGGKAITVKSQNGPDNCIIDCEGDGRGFIFESGESEASVVSGFTITNAFQDWGYGGGIYCVNSSSPTIEENIIIGNSAGWHGGGIYCMDSSNPVIQNNKISENSANEGSGIYCGQSSPIIINNEISGNLANSTGGGIQCWYSSPTINNNTITGNSANRSGGGIDCYGSSPTIMNNIITDNSVNYGGGGILLDGSAMVQNNEISRNSSDGDGGGVYCWSGSPIIQNNKISENSANEDGGGIWCYGQASPIIINNEISRNSADQYGGGIHSTYSSIINNTITGNFASTDGGAISCYGGTVTVFNTILWGNSSNEISIRYATIEITYSDIQDGWTGEGNIDTDPLFVDPENDDYHLTANSPCIDVGNNDAPSLPDTDFEGDQRVVDGDNDGDAIVDMGADEFQVQIPVSVNIKPGSCPNPLNVKSKGVLPVAVLGTEDFDVELIDPLTIQLSREGYEEGVTPLRSDYEDVATPYEGELCDCHDFNGDGFPDLTLKFSTQELVEILDLTDVSGEIIPFILTGNLVEQEGSTPIIGQDCVLIK